MNSRQSEQFTDYVNVAMIRLLDAIKDPERDVVLAAECALDVLVSHLEAEQCLEVVVPLILTEQSPVLQAAIRLLARLCQRLTPQLLTEQLPAIQPGLFDVSCYVAVRVTGRPLDTQMPM